MYYLPALTGMVFSTMYKKLKPKYLSDLFFMTKIGILRLNYQFIKLTTANNRRKYMVLGTVVE